MNKKWKGKSRFIYSHKSKMINVGCGLDIKKDWVNLDQHDKNGADCIFDLNNLFKGEKMPFKDNTFDYVYCSHVIEDFFEPMVIIDELIRICRVGGYIEIRTPTEMNLHLTNPYHKIPFTLFKFRAIVEKLRQYGKKYELEIVELRYYTDRNRGRIYNIFLWLNEFFYNLIPYQIVERTFIKFLLGFVNCKVVYRKIE